MAARQVRRVRLQLGETRAQKRAYEPFRSISVQLHEIEPEMFLFRRRRIRHERVKNSLLMLQLVHHRIKGIGGPWLELGCATLIEPCMRKAHNSWPRIRHMRDVLIRHHARAHRRRLIVFVPHIFGGGGM